MIMLTLPQNLDFLGEQSLVYLSLYSQHVELNKSLLNFKAWDNEKENTPHNITNTQLSGLWTFPCGSDGKESACNEGDLGLICGLGRSPGGGHDNHSSILAWRIPWTEEPGGLQSMGSQRVRHDWVTKHSTAHQGFPGGSVVMNPPAVQEMKVQFLSLEDPLEKETVTNFSILAWKIPWTQEPCGL